MRHWVWIGVSALAVFGTAQAKNDKQKELPPGLEKKVQSGKSLPPGWQKKLMKGDVLDRRVYEYGRVVNRDPEHGTISIAAENKVIRVIENTREIVEIIESF